MIASNKVELRIYNEDGLPIDHSDGKFAIMRSAMPPFPRR
jgi:hypothetical protein